MLPPPPARAASAASAAAAAAASAVTHEYSGQRRLQLPDLLSPARVRQQQHAPRTAAQPQQPARVMDDRGRGHLG